MKKKVIKKKCDLCGKDFKTIIPERFACTTCTKQHNEDMKNQ